MADDNKNPDFDEKEAIALFLQEMPVDHATLEKKHKPPEVIEETGAESERKAVLAADTPKEESRRKRSKQNDYQSVFMTESPITARIGKMVYVRNDLHAKIMKTIQVIGENTVSISSFVNNILDHHFESYKGDITELYDKKIKGIYDE